jgi:citrate lyase subunit beta/citryl-CoA lyase
MVPLPRRRSSLTVPGASTKMLAKALSLDADEIVFDLEDAVPVAHKVEARTQVAAILAAGAWRSRVVSVRINAVATAWYADDIEAVTAAGHPRLTLVVPKVENASDLSEVEGMIARHGAIGGPSLQALIETAAGVVNAQSIASATSRLQALIIGYADLAASLGRPAGSLASWQTVQDIVLLAARANGLQAIDGPFFKIDSEDELREECERARDQGFDGKWAIHPSQIETINAVFTPGADEVASARSLIAHLSRADGGATTFAGGMVDEAMRAAAMRTLARAGLTE